MDRRRWLGAVMIVREIRMKATLIAEASGATRVQPQHAVESEATARVKYAAKATDATWRAVSMGLRMAKRPMSTAVEAVAAPVPTRVYASAMGIVRPRSARPACVSRHDVLTGVATAMKPMWIVAVPVRGATRKVSVEWALIV